MFRRNFCKQRQKIKQKYKKYFEDCILGGVTKNEGLKNIGHGMSKVRDTKWLRFHICFIMTLHYKMWQIFLQNATAILLQNVTKVYNKMPQVTTVNTTVLYIILQLLQNTSILLQNLKVTTKCVSTKC